MRSSTIACGIACLYARFRVSKSFLKISVAQFGREHVVHVAMEVRHMLAEYVRIQLACCAVQVVFGRASC